MSVVMQCVDVVLFYILNTTLNMIQMMEPDHNVLAFSAHDLGPQCVQSVKS